MRVVGTGASLCCVEGEEEEEEEARAVGTEAGFRHVVVEGEEAWVWVWRLEMTARTCHVQAGGRAKTSVAGQLGRLNSVRG